MDVFAQRYAPMGIIGRGGNAVVYEAVDKLLDRRVALKVGEPTEEARIRMAREARVGSAVSHPNVCTIIDAGVTATREPYLVMELLRGETLATRIASVGALPRREALDITEQILDALEAAHDAGYLHRDVKPANVFLVPMKSGRTVVKVLDFGTAGHRDSDDAADFEQLTGAGLVLGTLRYMSPEQVRGDRDLDERSDLYSAALLLLEMLAGEHPLAHVADDKVADILGFQRVPTDHPGVPADLRPVLARALETERKRRLANVAAFRSALRTPQLVPANDTAATNVLPPMRPDLHRQIVEGWDQTTERDRIPAFEAEHDSIPVTVDIETQQLDTRKKGG